MSISAEVIGGRSTRRKIVCVNCGKHQMPSRRQRASRFRPTCRHCGGSRFDEASEMLEAEIAAVHLTKGNCHTNDMGRKFL